ncbi:hypothetical protein ACKGJY_15195 [Hyunsoonleella sp. 2307UL5-6]|uniref:hypothetical protein n=1 Tax=Hyunsoonleella sp. 2307UL5-6 TaxID=3384768 RepID=UPI0039BCA48E
MFNGKKFKTSLNELSENKTDSLFGTIEQQEKLTKGLKAIKDKHAEFFKDKEYGFNEIDNYFVFDNYTNKPKLEFKEYKNLDDNIKNDVLELFNSVYQ